MNEDERDQMADEAAHEVYGVFARHKVHIPESELFALNDYLTALARRLASEN